MQRGFTPGAWYGDYLPSGEWCATIPGQPLQTHLGQVALPPGEPWGIGYPRCSNRVPGTTFAVAGQSHSTLDPACREWWQGASWGSYPPPCVGTSPAIYDREGVLHRSDGSVGANGYRYVDTANRLVSGDATYGPFHGLFEYTALDTPDVWVGQAAYDGGGAQVLQRVPGTSGAPDQWILRQLELGDCRWLRANQSGDLVAICFSNGAGVVRLLATVQELLALPLVVPPAAPLPVVGRPLWLGCFEFDQTAGVGPGNTLLAVRRWSGALPRPFIQADETAGHLSGTPLGYYVGGATVEDIEAQAAALASRPVVYWDARRWPRWPEVPAGSWVCVQAYQQATESLDAFEADLRRVLDGAPAGQPLALVCQQYTSNASLTVSIAAQIPVYLRLARDYPSVVALLLFSGYGRAGGLCDHPSEREVWESQAALLEVPAIPVYPPEDPDDGGDGGDGGGPDPVPPYPLVQGVTFMQPERGWFIGPGDKALAVDASGRVSFDRTDLTDQDLLEALPIAGDYRCAVRSVQRDRYLTADSTQFAPGGNPCLAFYAAPAGDVFGPDGLPGFYQRWAFGQWAPASIVTAAVDYVEQGNNHGRPWKSPSLVWVKQG